MKNILVGLFATVVTCAAGQELASVRGRVYDDRTGELIAGANVRLVSQRVDEVAVTDSLGRFKFQVSPGRYIAAISFVGYSNSIHEVTAVSARATILSIGLFESSTVLESVDVTTAQPTQSGEYSFNIEKTTRIPANFFDPLRMSLSYPGFVVSNDQNNNIIVRGNSPNGILWRLNGLDIVNPNHLSNAGMFSDKPSASGGGVNIISAQLIDKTMFYAGAIPPQYGNLASGAVDMLLRSGNPNEHEFTAKASLIGIDLASEGPVSPSHNSSFLVNYRYSTVGILSGLDVNFGDEKINFQDLSFNLSFNGKGNRTLRVFGFGGLSTNTFEAKDSLKREEDKEWYDIIYDGKTFAAGATFDMPLPEKTKLTLGAAWSQSVQKRKTEFMFNRYESHDESYYRSNGIFSTIFRLSKNFETGELTLGATINYQVDSIFDRSLNRAELFEPDFCNTCPLHDQQAAGNSYQVFQPYLEWKWRIKPRLDLDLAARYFKFNKTRFGRFEPRIVLSYLVNSNSSTALSYGTVHQMQLLYIPEPDVEPVSSRRVSFEYSAQLKKSISLRGEVFFQSLDKILVDKTTGYATYNYLDEELPTGLTPDGEATNWGVQGNLEKIFSDGNYFILGGSFYDSKYTLGGKKGYDSRFNGKYTFSFTAGRDWSKPDKSRLINLNWRLLYFGGLREAPIDPLASHYTTSFDYSGGYTEKLKDYLRLDLSVSFVKNKPGYTRTLTIDIQNITNIENDSHHYVDFTNNKVILKKQLGIIPILIYRIDF